MISYYHKIQPPYWPFKITGQNTGRKAEMKFFNVLNEGKSDTFYNLFTFVLKTLAELPFNYLILKYFGWTETNTIDL